MFLDRLVFTDITCKSGSRPLDRSDQRLIAYTGSVIPLDIWINVESSLGIVCICLPRMRPLLAVLIPAGWRAFVCGSPNGSKESYTLTDQSNIRGRLRRIPSTATSNTELPGDRHVHFAPSQKDGFVSAELRYGERSVENVDEILPAHSINQRHDVERQQPVKYNL